jgi:plastocyanin
MSVPLPRSAAALAIAIALLTACGDDGSDAESAATPAETSSEAAEGSAPADGGQTQSITATEGEMFIELSSHELSAGSHTIEVVNDGSATHDLVVERDGEDVGATDSIAPGDSATLTVDLEAGEYVFYCSIGNHRSMGMEVTVTVT